jgi:hypothetical protein
MSQILIRIRGKELTDNFNLLFIDEFFWKQSSKWPNMAVNYMDKIADVYIQFLKDFLL